MTVAAKRDFFEALTQLALEGGAELYEILKDMTAEELIELLRERKRAGKPPAGFEEVRE